MLGTIQNIADEADGIKRVTIGVPQIAYTPGQFVQLAFSETSAKHSFSIVSYTDNALTLAIKIGGSFTHQLCASPQGTRICVYGPYGRFILPPNNDPVVMIAGGIGITPLYCMLCDIVNANKQTPTYLFYSTKTKSATAFLEPLKTIKKNYVHIHFAFTHEGDAHVTASSIKECTPDFGRCQFYICGPPPMIRSLSKQLQEEGIAEKNIWSELFT